MSVCRGLGTIGVECQRPSAPRTSKPNADLTSSITSVDTPAIASLEAVALHLPAQGIRLFMNRM